MPQATPNSDVVVVLARIANLGALLLLLLLLLRGRALSLAMMSSSGTQTTSWLRLLGDPRLRV